MKRLGRYFLVMLAALLGLVLLYQLWVFGHILLWRWVDPGETSFMALRLEQLQEKNPKAELRQRWVPYERISVHLKRAVVAAEDDSFVAHEGFDWNGIQKALEKNHRRGRVVAGGSTISQQLAKNLFLSPRKSYFRKVEEALITVMLEAVLDKRRILEIYLNVVEWGDGVFGAEAAARRYFGVSAAQLNSHQAARLAVMLPNPRRFERQFGPRLSSHASRVQARMHYSEVP
jgi:monofunctional biosynthetic peptidoglycan transglycosylase